MAGLLVQNIGSVVSRNRRLTEIRETIPPFGVVELCRATGGKTHTAETGQTVWYASKPGPDAHLRRADQLAINGPTPIPYGGWGYIPQDEPLRGCVATRDAKGRAVELLRIGDALGPRHDSWLLWPEGAIYTYAGLDTIVAKELGADADRKGKWSKLPPVVPVWISRRSNHPVWMHGFDRLARYGAASSEAPVNMADTLKYWIVQPPKTRDEWARKLAYPFEPIDDKLNHLMPGDLEIPEEKRLPQTNDVGWCKVRESGVYMVHFSGTITPVNYVDDKLGAPLSIGLFAARPVQRGETADYQDYKRIKQPAAMLTRRSRVIGTIGASPFGPESILGPAKLENAAAATIMELEAGWAFAFLTIGAALEVYHWSLSVVRLGPTTSQSVETYWQSVTPKVTDDDLPIKVPGLSVH
jgi:hypothetical protein